ncbi:MAG: acetyltransferase [Pseudomonadota bacterium]
MGAGGIAVVAIDVLVDMGKKIDFCIDDNDTIQSLQGVDVVSSKSFHPAKNYKSAPELLVCVGDCAARKRLARAYVGPFGKAIHPTAIISNSARIGEGSMVFHGAILQANALLGKHVIINTGASVDHDCKVGNFVHIGPHSTLCGLVTIEDGAYLGAAVTVLPGVRIGASAIIGAGAVVIEDVPPKSTYVGVPARRVEKRMPLKRARPLTGVR